MTKNNQENLDDVDKILSKMDGRIVRKATDTDLCNHGTNQKCANCLPLDVSAHTEKGK
jgi:hypothetical protein